MCKKRFLLVVVAAACVGAIASAQGAVQTDYTVPALEQFFGTGTIAGLTQAYTTLNNGINDATVTGDKRQLILLHVVARMAMLGIDKGNTAYTTSLLEVMEPLGFSLTGTKFFTEDESDPEGIQFNRPLDPADANCFLFPVGVDFPAAAASINDNILPALNTIITELNQVTNSPAFVMTVTKAQMNRADDPNARDIEVDYSDVLALKAGLLSLKALLYAVSNVPYDVQIDLTNAIFNGWQCGELTDPAALTTILSTYPNLGEVLGGTGTTKLTQIKQNLIAAIDAVAAAIQSVLDETDDQTTDLFQIEAEDEAQNVAMRTELLKFRNSLANGTAATYTLGSQQSFNLRQNGSNKGIIFLEFGPPLNEPDEGWFSITNPEDGFPGWWQIDWFDINGNEFMGSANTQSGGNWFNGWFNGTISTDGSQITSMTFNWNTWNNGGNITGLSAVRQYNTPVTLAFNPGPLFNGTVSPRDILPQADPNGNPVPGTMGHALNNDATIGGVFPGMTQQDWIPFGYEVYGGNTDLSQTAGNWYKYRHIGQFGYTKLGESTGANVTVTGNYTYYVIAARGTTLIDAIRWTTSPSSYASSITFWDAEGTENMTGAPDETYGTMGEYNFLDLGNDEFTGYVVVTNPGSATGLTVLTGGAQPVVTASVSPASVAANGTSASTITITVRDSFGAVMSAVPAASIVVAATGTGNTITQPTAATNGSGQTTASIRSTVAEAKSISVTVEGVESSNVATVTFTAGAANKLVFTAQPVGPYAAGAAINAIPKVTVQDAQGNTLTSSTASITMAIGTNPGSGTLSGTKVRTVESGVATFSGLSINKVGTGYTLQATSPGLTSAVSNAFNVIADTSTAHLVFSTQPGDSPALGTIVGPPTVSVQDNYGNTVTTVNPEITVAIKTGTGDATATLSGTVTRTTASGVAAFNDLSINRADTDYQLTATATGMTAVDSAAFDITAQPALTIAKVDDVDPVDPGDDVVYTITYGNEGLAAAANVVIQETLPAGMTFVSASNSGTHSGGVITWNVADIPADTNGLTVTFTAHVSDTLADGGVVTNSNLTIVCDGVQAVGQTTAETTTVTDGKAPQVSGQIPEPNSASAALQPMIRLHVTDGGSGVAYTSGTVRIYVEDDLVYDGSEESPEGVYDSTDAEQLVRGVCRRTGTAADYAFTFLPTTKFRYEQEVNVRVEASDVSSNEDTTDYAFQTQLRSFGENAKVNSDTGTAIQDNPAVATDPSGNIWVAWDQKATSTAAPDIYVAKLAEDGNAFGASVLVYQSDDYQSNPAVAVDPTTGRLYVAWEQWTATDPNHQIMMASSADGATWTDPNRVNPAPDQGKPLIVASNPSIVVTQSNQVNIAWQETRNSGDSDIWLRTYTLAGGFAAAAQLTTDTANQTEPFAGLDSEGNVYVVWTDARNAGTTGTDIYRAASSVGPWTNVALVNSAGNQSQAVGATAGTEHHVWVDSNDLLYSFMGVAWSTSVLDPNETDALPAKPTMAAGTGDPDRVYAAWVDSRNVVGTNSDTDIYFTEDVPQAQILAQTVDVAFGTNILVNDDTGTHRQTKPAMGLDADANPYLVWVDNRSGNDDIYFAGATAILPPYETTVTPGEGGAATVQSASETNLQVQIPADALPEGVEADDITIAEVENLPAPPTGGFGLGYSFGPSGAVFTTPVTIRIPLAADAPVYSTYTVYRYDAGTGAWTTEGIHNPATKVTVGDVSYLEVAVDHFSIFVAAGAAAGSHHGGGGGCALSPWTNAGPIDVLLPFVVCVLALLTWNIVSGLRRRIR